MVDKRTVNVEKDVEKMVVYVAKPPRVGSVMRLTLKNGFGRYSSMADFLVSKVDRSKIKVGLGGKKFKVVLKKL